MALLESVIVPLGTKMPDFKLHDPYGKKYEGSELYAERGLLVGFMCNHCPYTIAVWPRFVHLANYAKNLRINTVAINPNIHPDYPEDSPDRMKKRIEELNISFPYLVDDTQQTAKAFKAQCTPDIYLFNAQHELVYHGRIDDNWQNEEKVTREELKEALNNHVAGLPVTKKQNPTMGCSIKWLSTS